MSNRHQIADKSAAAEATNNNNNDMKNMYKIPDNYSTLQSMSEIKKCVEKISSLQKVLKDSSSNSRSSFDQVDRAYLSSISTKNNIVSPQKTFLTKDLIQSPLGITTKTTTTALTVTSKCISNASSVTENQQQKQLKQPQNENQVIKDGNYFLKVLKSEQLRLLAIADDIEKEITLLSEKEDQQNHKYDDVLGLLRSASGKARLLVSQKMKQFEDLCYKNLNQKDDEKFKTTNEDLQGFWDMVYLQVDHIDSLFSDIEKLKQNNWIMKEEEPNFNSKKSSELKTNSTTVKKGALKQSNSQNINGGIGGSKAATVNNNNKFDARRKELLEMKRKAKNAIQQQNQSTDTPKDPNKLEIFF